MLFYLIVLLFGSFKVISTVYYLETAATDSGLTGGLYGTIRLRLPALLGTFLNNISPPVLRGTGLQKLPHCDPFTTSCILISKYFSSFIFKTDNLKFRIEFCSEGDFTQVDYRL